MNNEEKITVLEEYKELNELKNRAEKRLKEIKEEIKLKFKPGQYGQLALEFKEVEVKEYTVAARIDHRIIVTEIGKKRA